MWFYRNVVSKFDGTRCGMYPTCSAYATQAIRRHGVFLGGFLAADRLLHENAAQPPEYATVVKFGVRRVYDPVEKNDTWFAKHARPARPVLPDAALSFSGAARTPAAEEVDPDAARRLAGELLAAAKPYAAVTELERVAQLAASPGERADALLDGARVAAGAALAEPDRERSENAWDDADRLLSRAGRIAAEAQDVPRERAADAGRAVEWLDRGIPLEARRRFDVLAGGGDPDARLLAAWAAAEVRLDDGVKPAKAATPLAYLARAPDLSEDVRLHAADAARIVETMRIPHRSPGVAMGLSFVVPGAGYVYAGHPVLGLGSFVLNGVFLTGIAASVRDRNYALAGALLTLEVGWYVGGAGGAAEAVIADREAARDRLLPPARRRVFAGLSPNGLFAGLRF